MPEIHYNLLLIHDDWDLYLCSTVLSFNSIEEANAYILIERLSE